MNYDQILKDVSSRVALPIREVQCIVLDEEYLDCYTVECVLCRRRFKVGEHVLKLLPKNMPALWNHYVCANGPECKKRAEDNNAKVEKVYVSPEGD